MYHIHKVKYLKRHFRWLVAFMFMKSLDVNMPSITCDNKVDSRLGESVYQGNTVFLRMFVSSYRQNYFCKKNLQAGGTFIFPTPTFKCM